MRDSTRQIDLACPACGNGKAVVTESGPHFRANCAACGRYIKFVSKREIGEGPRTVASTHDGIKPKQRLRIFERAGGRCELCGRPSSNVILHVGHVLSVSDGHAQGLTDAEINDDGNLIALCEECNLGQGRESASPRLLAILLSRRGQHA